MVKELSLVVIGSHWQSLVVIGRLIRLGTLSKKKNDIIWEFFPTWGGSSQIPKLL